MPTTRQRSSVSVVLADDHPAIVDSLSRFLAGAGFDVVATAADGAAALAEVERRRPRVLVADLHMPRLDGLELARRVGEGSSGAAVLLYTGDGDRALVTDALDAGAQGFALKEAPLEDLARAVDVVARGGLYVDPVLAAQLASGPEPGRLALSRREREVLRLLSGGGSYAEIGAQLFLSPDTVRAHAQRAMTKLGARTRTQAVAVAVREQLIA
ncbi:MAG TPA: response regulator transcription factor [Gaiellaceae bacterium]|nr:response regulator transcription factor [Gaiellaceae bacterium]